MRVVGLLVLAIFFPALAHAAPPSLTTYTVSHDTIYPSATADSGLATTTSIDIAFSEQVKASIKIVSASSASVKSLYSSSSVTNPAPKIWDGTNTTGATVGNGTYTILILATSTATNLTMTDSSKTVTIASPDSTLPAGFSSENATTTTTTTSSSGGAPPEYMPIPTLRIITDGDRTVSSGADTAFTAAVYDGKGNRRDDALVIWTFGDGMKRTGANVFHKYYYPGDYVAVVRVSTSDGGDETSESIVTVKDASVKIVSVSERGITLTSGDTRTLDLSLWRLSMGGKEFKIPTDTHILAGRTILFPSQVIELPIADSASLLYPSGEVAVTYPATIAAAQPSTPAQGYKQTQAVESPAASKAEPIINQKADVQAYEKAVIAPAEATKSASAGAALPQEPSVPASRTAGIFQSPWTLGFLGMFALAGGAFIFL